jgi:hypothetical protein
MPIARRKDSAPVDRAAAPIVGKRESRSRSEPEHRRASALGVAPRRWLAPIATFYRRYAVRQQLRTVDHRMIMDLGGHDRVCREILKPFWRG